MGSNITKIKTEIYFKGEKGKEEDGNILVFRIQPEEGIKIRFWTKKPGFPRTLEQKILSFNYEHKNISYQ